MSKKRIVVALGGNALGNNAQEQLNLVKKTACTIVDLIADGHDVIVGHGNGPQVGMINLALDEFATRAGTPCIPLPECGAMSQGYIGYHLQQAIYNELHSRSISKNVVSLITQTIVDKDDDAFKNPTKPVGAFYTKEQAEALAQEKGDVFAEDAGRGYRRVVPSPAPQRIVEIDTIKELVDRGNIVISAGGGGIPVTKGKSGLSGIPAVIDKDKSCAILAASLKADVLLILTAVDFVYTDFNTENQKALTKISASEALQHRNSGHFAKGSMLPKIDACLDFLSKNPAGVAIITSPRNAKTALDGSVGTVIFNKMR